MDGDLSERQSQILEKIAEGLSNNQIATRFHLSTQTVAYHVRRLMKRLDAVNRAALVARAYHAGLLDLDEWPPSSRPRSEAHRSSQAT